MTEDPINDPDTTLHPDLRDVARDPKPDQDQGDADAALKYAKAADDE